ARHKRIDQALNIGCAGLDIREGIRMLVTPGHIAGLNKPNCRQRPVLKICEVFRYWHHITWKLIRRGIGFKLRQIRAWTAGRSSSTLRARANFGVRWWSRSANIVAVINLPADSGLL